MTQHNHILLLFFSEVSISMQHAPPTPSPYDEETDIEEPQGDNVAPPPPLRRSLRGAYALVK